MIDSLSIERVADPQAWTAARALPQVPIVVLPQNPETAGSPASQLTGMLTFDGIRADLDALSALDETFASAASRDKRLDAALADASTALGRLAASLTSAYPVPKIAIPLSPVHYYFGVRIANLSPEQCATQTLAIVYRSLADLSHALVDVNDLVAEAEAALSLLRSMIPRNYSAAGPPKGAISRVCPLVEPSGDGLERWILAHHEYFMFNVHAAARVRQAVKSILDGANERAALLLTQASLLVRGFTAAMAHSAAVPASYYSDVIRPTMCPPATPFPLSGRMQPEHASYRAAVKQLLHVSPEPFLALSRRSEILAQARDEFLDADLVDIERHVQVAHALVGNERSLVQSVQATDSAVSTLRGMRHARAARYCRLMRFGDIAFLDNDKHVHYAEREDR